MMYDGLGSVAACVKYALGLWSANVPCCGFDMSIFECVMYCMYYILLNAS